MPDTIVLAVKIKDPLTQTIIDKSFANKWSPSLNGVLFPPYDISSSKNKKCTLNPDREDKERGQYMPHLTFYKQVVRSGFLYILYISFSAPKVLYGNNLEESRQMELPVLCSRLSALLSEKGVHLSVEEILKSEVKAIHYGKNVVLQNWMSPRQIINYVSKADIPLKKNTDFVRYKNEGMALHIYTNERSLCLYDKLEELKKAKLTEKGNIEKDNQYQLWLLHHIGKVIKQPFKVLRIESRLETKKAIRDCFKKLKIKVPHSLTLEDLYKEDLGKAVLSNEIKMLEENIPVFSSCREPPENFAEYIRILNPKAKAENIAFVVGVMTIERNVGMRNTRMLLGAKESAKWRNIKNKLERLAMPNMPIDYLAEIHKQIESFKPLKLEDYLKK
ncbi:hypothetical protein IKG49_01640 [Candidatus Saccharibacteria bacterium]|nr:hypothetical protein [Candidatus Saccharibacteria bacterium]